MMPGFEMHPDAFLPFEEPPWPLRWESDARIDDGHAHEWEWVVCRSWRGKYHRRASDGSTFDTVIRCSVCHVPRCGDVKSPDPCMERRHHLGMHFHFSGGVDLLGGLMRVASERDEQ